MVKAQSKLIQKPWENDRKTIRYGPNASSEVLAPKNIGYTHRLKSSTGRKISKIARIWTHFRSNELSQRDLFHGWFFVVIASIVVLAVDVVDVVVTVVIVGGVVVDVVDVVVIAIVVCAPYFP